MGIDPGKMILIPPTSTILEDPQYTDKLTGLKKAKTSWSILAG